ncbi:hypothetical protein WME94_34410 [Sorangium sp. So ce429]
MRKTVSYAASLLRNRPPIAMVVDLGESRMWGLGRLEGARRTGSRRRGAEGTAFTPHPAGRRLAISARCAGT